MKCFFVFLILAGCVFKSAEAKAPYMYGGIHAVNAH